MEFCCAFISLSTKHAAKMGSDDWGVSGDLRPPARERRSPLGCGLVRSQVFWAPKMKDMSQKQMFSQWMRMLVLYFISWLNSAAYISWIPMIPIPQSMCWQMGLSIDGAHTPKMMVMENPNPKFMMSGGSPISGNLQIWGSKALTFWDFGWLDTWPWPPHLWANW